MRLIRLFLLLAPLCLPSVVLAVCLLGDYSVQTEFNRSVAVIVGTATDERATPSSKAFYEGTTYRVSIEETIRGHPRAAVELFSENSSGRFPMNKGEKYILFIYQESGRLAVDNCGNSGLVAEKQDVLKAVRQLAKARLRH